jgi:16S rRNA (cytosine967-C5)-methyltransferase
LIYATCSSEPEENESVVDRFLADARQFEAVDLRTADTRVPPVVIDARGHLRTLPHAHGLEAFFAAAFTRRS